MADNNTALHAQLEALDLELEDGDITRKGYEKRRTMILSQYLGPQEVERLIVVTQGLILRLWGLEGLLLLEEEEGMRRAMRRASRVMGV
jgi:hypothetical protein